MASAVARAYNRGLGVEPPAGSRGEASRSWKHFKVSNVKNKAHNHLCPVFWDKNCSGGTWWRRWRPHKELVIRPRRMWIASCDRCSRDVACLFCLYLDGPARGSCFGRKLLHGTQDTLYLDGSPDFPHGFEVAKLHRPLVLIVLVTAHVLTCVSCDSTTSC